MTMPRSLPQASLFRAALCAAVGGIRPEGWYWYGWDYMHAGDAVELPEEFLDTLPAAFLELMQKLSGGKRWTLEEIEQDLIDAAVVLLERLTQAQRAAAPILGWNR